MNMQWDKIETLDSLFQNMTKFGFDSNNYTSFHFFLVCPFLWKQETGTFQLFQT